MPETTVEMLARMNRELSIKNGALEQALEELKAGISRVLSRLSELAE